MISNFPAGGGHPRGFDFNYEFWFECGCGRRIQVSDTAYDLQCQGVEPYPVCVCGSTIDVSEARPTLRDLSDIDRQPEQVDRHVWYHSSTYQDWPSPTYRDNVAALVEQSLLPSDKHAAMIAERTSLALHLGTYAAAIENMLRRTADEGSPSDQYWLHQVEVRLQPGDLSPEVHRELAKGVLMVPPFDAFCHSSDDKQAILQLNVNVTLGRRVEPRAVPVRSHQMWPVACCSRECNRVTGGRIYGLIPRSQVPSRPQ